VFVRKTVAETIMATLREDVPDIHSSGAQVPPALEQVLRRCLNKDPSKRFRSAQDVAVALSTVRIATTSSPAQSPAPATSSSTRRGYLAVVALALALGAILWFIFFA
jgi:serine/threonine protein kinase